ncbi:MAG: ArsC/Spx/MgsR family protein [Bacteroidota bacterium]
MRKIFHLSTCNTCQRIINELDLHNRNVELQDIKVQNVSEAELDMMKEHEGSYEKLFSRRAMKFRSQGWHEKELSEQDYKRLILEEYTFLKRPVLVLEGEVFVGNTKKVVALAKEKLDSE